ncbi:hypothetical protein RF55_13072, partial [Lasius niger]
MSSDDSVGGCNFEQMFIEETEQEVGDNNDPVNIINVSEEEGNEFRQNNSNEDEDRSDDDDEEEEEDDDDDNDDDDDDDDDNDDDNDDDDDDNDDNDDDDNDDNDDNDNDDNDDDDDDVIAFADDHERGLYIRETIRQWALEGGGLSMIKLDALLARLHPIFPEVPLSYKTLLSTPKHLDVIEFEDNTQMWYKSIQANLDSMNLREYLQRFNKITIDINVDGLPLSKSSKQKFWPILGKLVGSKNEPFIIAVHHGNSNPEPDEYLMDFVLEIQDLSENGYTYNGQLYQFVVRHYICDAPARAMMKGIVEHGGYYACEKCTVVGEWIQNRIVYLELDQVLRTDESLMNREQPSHHRAESLLEIIPTVQECTAHGNVESFSAYPFENKLKSIKSILQSGYKPLHQVAYRDRERNHNVEIVLEDNNHIQLSMKHFLLEDNVQGSQFRCVSVNGDVLKVNKRDSCFRTKTGEVFVVFKFLNQEDSDNEFYDVGLAQWLETEIDANMKTKIKWPSDSKVAWDFVRKEKPAHIRTLMQLRHANNFFATPIIKVLRRWDGDTELRENLIALTALQKKNKIKQTIEIVDSKKAKTAKNILQHLRKTNGSSRSFVQNKFLETLNNKSGGEVRIVVEPKTLKESSKMKQKAIHSTLLTEALQKETLKENREKKSKEATQTFVSHSDTIDETRSSTSFNKEGRNDANSPTLFTDTAQYISWKNNCNMEEIPKSDLCSPSATTANLSDSFCDSVSNSSHDENTEIHDIVEENVSEDSNISHQISNRAMESRFDVKSQVSLSSLKKEVREVSSKLDIVIMNQERLNRFIMPTEKVVKRPSKLPSLPIKTEGELAKMEQFLSEENNLSAT